jgi:CBS domain-containing protein
LTAIYHNMWPLRARPAAARALLAGTYGPLAAFRTSSPSPSHSDTVAHSNRARSSGDDRNGRVAPRKPRTVADIMTRDVISVSPDTRVREIAEMLVRNRVSAVPVVDDERRLVGIVSEDDLVRRAEIGTERDRRWWTEMFRDTSEVAGDYIKAHGRKAKDVMTPRPVAATDDMSLDEVARLLEKRRVKRLPVLRDGRVVGIVSRADLVRALAESEEEVAVEAVSDEVIEKNLTARIEAMPVGGRLVHASVQNGVASLLGPVFSVAERRALHVVAENTPGVRAVDDRLFRWPPQLSKHR